MRSHFLLASLGVLASVAGVAKADNLVANPDFTSTNITFPGYTSATNNQISGWTGTGGYGATGFNVGGFWNNGTLPSGDDSVGFIQIDGTLSTTVNGLVAGQTYELSFLENSRTADGDGCCNAVPNVSVALGGLTLLGSMADPAVGGSNPFTSMSTEFTATGSSEVLTFAANTGAGSPDGTATFSDVSVSAVTPEPSSVALLGTGLMAGIGALRRRRLA